MAYSRKDKFFITILEKDKNKDKEMEVFAHKPSKRLYLCSEREQTFYIRMKSLNKVDKYYGSRLYIDGKEVMNGLKTFFRQGHYFGFKLGGGEYKSFMFDIPPTCEETNLNITQDQIKSENKNFGTIKIEFFNTQEIKSKKLTKKHNYNIHNQSIREDDKKFFYRSLSIKEGDKFSIDSNFKYIDQAEDEYVINHITDYNDKVDDIMLYYTDFIAMQLLGIVYNFLIFRFP